MAASLLLLLPPVGHVTETAPQVQRPHIEDLGNQRYRIGAIEVDKERQSFRVPGVVLRNKPPLEYVAVTKGGYKAYESLLELATDAYEFNLACILIGLDATRAKQFNYHFDERHAEGDPVAVTVSWTHAGKEVTVPAAELLREGDQAPSSGDWVYIGSSMPTPGRFLAAEFGTLVGFVHDPGSIIEHREGVGMHNYGGVTINDAIVPPVGAPVTLSVRRLMP